MAAAIRDAKTPSDQIRALIEHHNNCGGGVRWFEKSQARYVSIANSAKQVSLRATTGFGCRHFAVWLPNAV